MTAPTPAQLARALREAADLVDRHGAKALELAPLLAARGWGTSTLGDGGSRGTTDDTTTERAALNRSPYRDVDARLLRWWQATWTLTTAGADLITKITAHAALDEDHDGRATNTPGSGACIVCTKWATGGVNDKLIAGYCNPCRVSWQGWRARQIAAGKDADRGRFAVWRRGELAPTEPAHVDPTVVGSVG